MTTLIFNCRCCNHKCSGTKDQAELFNCRRCEHTEWDEVGVLVDREMFFYIETRQLVHIDKLTRKQMVDVGLPVPASHA